ncbi:NACHT, LRR and PYD domains-containing protein 3-like [Dysidea avara]|uniref:NACHT, LRR and PYD domains-containing protein 3-like n=1 Tax=Dysidea avara TaxID=196820 RepID=UPI00332ECEE9
MQEAKTVRDLIVTPDDDLRNNVVKEITSNSGEGVCFIIEGYDELDPQSRTSSIFTDLKKEFLPNCTLVYTSRPEACYRLERAASQNISIEGYTEESVNKYISNAFSSNTELAVELKSQLQMNAIVKKMLHIPIFVAIVCLIFFRFSMLPETLTQLYTLLCLRLVLRHISTRTQNLAQLKILRSLNHLPGDISTRFSELCYVAKNGTEQRKTIFNSQSLLEIGIVDIKTSDLGLLITTPTTSEYGIEESYRFLHKTLQEFCAAWYISKMPIQEQLKYINAYWNDDYYESVWRFYCGITELSDIDVLGYILLPFKLLKSRLTMWRIPLLMECVFEAQNSEVCQTVGDYLDGIIDVSGIKKFEVGSHRVRAIGYFFKHYKGTIKQIHAQYLYDEQFLILLELLQKRELQDDIVVLSIPDCSFTYRSLSIPHSLFTMQHGIVELSIKGTIFNTETDESSTHLSNMQLLSNIICSNTTLNVLDISYANIGPEGATYFANLRNVSLCDISMAFCGLGCDGVDKIGEMLYHNKSIVSIDLSNNSVGDSGMTKFVRHFNDGESMQLRHLNLSYNGITAIGAAYLKKLMEIDNSTITSIELSCNPLRDEGISAILSSLNITMEHIGLKGVLMTSDVLIAAALFKTKSISFDQPNICELINCNVAKTTALRHIELVITSDAANYNILNSIKKNGKIEKLKLEFLSCEKLVGGITKLLKQNKTLTELTLKCYNGLSPPSLVEITKSLTSNNFLKILKFCDKCIDQAAILNFLEHLKHVYAVKELIFELLDDDDQFLEDVKKQIQEINQHRCTNGVSNPLKVEIIHWAGTI